MESYGSPVEKKIEYGGFWARVFARLIDLIILVFVNTLLQFLIGGGDYYMAITAMIGLGYYVFMESGSRQGTVGKMILDLKVTTLDYQRISIPRAFVRYFAKMISSIPMVIGIIYSFDEIAPLQSQSEIQEWMMTSEASFFLTMAKVSIVLMIICYGMAGIHPRKQALHDILVKTYVVKQPERNPAEA